jgi:voltage-gated potassium channel
VKPATPLLAMLAAPKTRSSVWALGRLLLVFFAAVAVFSVGFHAIMATEGRDFSWPTSIYWTIVTMSTLGFGDIVFESDLGRAYSVVVLLTGSLIILILLPFTFIQFVYVPWREAMRRARAPREVAATLSGHLVVTGQGPVEELLIHRAEAAGVPYVLLVDDVEHAVSLHDHGYEVMVGALDDPDTYRRVRAAEAAMIVTARADTTNTNVAFTVREVAESATIVATANSADSVDILELAGCDRVLQLGELLGRAFAERILSPAGRSTVISHLDGLLIAEAVAGETSLVGSRLGDLNVRARTGVSIVGLWDRGRFRFWDPDLTIDRRSILVLTGVEQQLARYDELYRDAPDPDRTVAADGQVLVIGGGRVGRAVARAVKEGGTSCTIVERLSERVRPEFEYVVGDAADIEVLRDAGIETATAVVVTTHDDDTNVYLTLYARRLRPDVQVFGRVTLDRNVSTMHRAGADFVLSYASTGATAIWNELREDRTLLLAQGLLVFRVPVPPRLAGRALVDTAIRPATGCNVIGVIRSGECSNGFAPDDPLPPDGELVLIGDEEAEDRFLARYVTEQDGSRLRRWWSRVRR